MESISFEEHIPAVMEFLLLDKVTFFVDKGRFSELPTGKQAYASYANKDLLEAIGTPITRKPKELFCYSSPELTINALKRLRSDESFKGINLIGITCGPLLLAEHLSRLDLSTFHIDFGFDWGLSIPSEHLKEVQQMGFIAQLTPLNEVFVVHETKRLVMPMELDKQNYTMCFVNPDDAAPMLEQMKADYPDCQLVSLDPRKLAKSLLSSDFGGMLINPGLSSQITLTRRDLEIYLYAASLKRGGGFSLGKLMRELGELVGMIFRRRR